MMMIGRVFTAAVAVVALAGTSPVIGAQNKQEKRTQEQQRDIQALVQLVDAVSAGKQPAPTDVGITWQSNHFVRGAEGSTYIPFTVAVDRNQLGKDEAALYVRVVSKTPAAATSENDKDRDKNEPAYPWDNVYFTNLDSNGKVSRAMALKPGQYDVFLAVKEQTPKERQRNQPPAKIGLLRHELTVPDFSGPDLSTSSVIVASVIEAVATPLSPEQQQENPYTFGTMRVVPAEDVKLKTSEELQVLFWIYGTQQANGKPDVQVEYNFHQKTPEGEKFFNKTAPQGLNAQTLPAQFDLNAGHQLPGSLVVPLASFPAGDYRLEIKVTDKLSGKSLTQDTNFTVES
jgi:hypothetical protein